MHSKKIYIILICYLVVAGCVSIQKRSIENSRTFFNKVETRIIPLGKDSLNAIAAILPKGSTAIKTECFSKVEIGITLPEVLSNEIEKFLNNANISYPNPYDPDDINIEGYFYSNRDTVVRPGFYFKDYYRDLKANNSWKDKYTDYNWRIRFSPPDTGIWQCRIRINFPNSNIPEIACNPLTIYATEGTNEGFMQIASNNINFSRSRSNKNFMAIGQNIAWPEGPFFKGGWLNGGEAPYYFANKNFKKRLFNVGLMDIEDYVKNAAQNNANLIRIVSWQDSYLFEWEERGVYGSRRSEGDENFKRQKRAWELDQLFNTAESSNIMLLFCLEFHGQFCYDWNNGDANSYKFNPYQVTESDGKKIKNLPVNFFSDPQLKEDYKKKLRYFMARWGHSTSLGVFQLLSEYDGWGSDSINIHNRLSSSIKKNPQVQMDIRNWHEEMGNYLHDIGGRPLIVTSGCTNNIMPQSLPPSRNIYYTSGIDLIISNVYQNVRSSSFIMFGDAKAATNKINKPYLFTETGLLTDPVKSADPNDIESCSDVTFHNFLWAAACFGNAGTSLEWWQIFDNERRKNFRSAYSFFNDIDFNTHTFSEKNAWSDKGTAIYLCGNLTKLVNKNSTVEAYYVCSSKKDKGYHEVYGWTHNLSYYWSNLAIYMKCADRNDHLPVVGSCNFDKYSAPVKLDPSKTFIQIKKLKPKVKYNVLWYSTQGEGGVIQQNEIISKGNGTASIQWPGDEWDYAFRLIEVHNEMMIK